jgi:hypothetical protein
MLYQSFLFSFMHSLKLITKKGDSENRLERRGFLQLVETFRRAALSNIFDRNLV